MTSRERLGCGGTRRQQALIWNIQSVMQALDHAHTQTSLAIEYFGDPASRTNEWFEITRRQALLDRLEPAEDRLQIVIVSDRLNIH